MHKLLILFFPFLSSIIANAQDFNNLSFGNANNLDVVTWNIEHFPKNGGTTLDFVSEIVEALDAEIIALQEIDNINVFTNMVNELENYSYYYDPDWQEGLAYIYKNTEIEVLDAYYIFEQSWFIFPRAPLVLEVKFKNQDYILINNHLKCCGDGNLDLQDDGDEETRRFDANNLLKEYIDYNFNTHNVILLGDLNDNLTDNENDNVFQMFLDDSENFEFADYTIAQNSSNNWSYPTWPSHLDHILISNELFDEFEHSNSKTETIKLDEYMGSFWSYDNNISDHRPVGLSLFIDTNVATEEVLLNNLSIFPNPAKSNEKVTIEVEKNANNIEIYDLNGKLTFKQHLANQTSIVVNGLNAGIYFIKVSENNIVLQSEKLIIF